MRYLNVKQLLHLQQENAISSSFQCSAAASLVLATSREHVQLGLKPTFIHNQPEMPGISAVMNCVDIQPDSFTDLRTFST